MEATPTQATMALNLEVFAEIDLNLMVTFLVIYGERNLTRSATKLGVGQPAVSGSLARLRAQFDDALFVRAGFGVEPTPTADQIARRLLPAMTMIESILAQPRLQRSSAPLPSSYEAVPVK